MASNNEIETQTLLHRLSDISGSLRGLSGLFSQASPHACLQDEEYYGLGQLLSHLSSELLNIEDFLREKYKECHPGQLSSRTDAEVVDE
ncbi:MAG: hypothetical protein HRT44_04165 [Bdellovibrionales bacterium]|nr:hypothetical protein [Bdellovibrionales bacterium]NQZ18438.1 hypothetical protein [Bdellovibrionales bacterium]